MAEQQHRSTFEHYSNYCCSAAELHRWHSRPGALERLIPPWEKTRITLKTGTIDPGDRTHLRMSFGPFPIKFHALHIDNIPGEMFRDIQEKGPFSHWSHSHFFADRKNGTELYDKVDYALPCHGLLPSYLKHSFNKELQRVFRHRQEILNTDIDLHNKCSTKPLHILISGAGGVLGRELVPLLTTGGHKVWRLVRHQVNPEANEIFWDTEKNSIDISSIPELDGVIHLAGEYIGLSRWSKEKKNKVIESRVNGTKLLCQAICSMPKPPKVFLCGSAVGFYGDTGSEIISEKHSAGDDFISDVCEKWEYATRQASQAGIRTVFLRMGVGLTPRGGALQKILTYSPLGFIRRFGSGKQYISWMSSDDMVSSMLHCLTCETLEGPVNIAAPEPVTNEEFLQTLAKVTGRPLLFPVSAGILRTVYGQMASEILLSGCRTSVGKLKTSGFVFRHPTLETALRAMLGKWN